KEAGLRFRENRKRLLVAELGLEMIGLQRDEHVRARVHLVRACEAGKRLRIEGDFFAGSVLSQAQANQKRDNTESRKHSYPIPHSDSRYKSCGGNLTVPRFYFSNP